MKMWNEEKYKKSNSDELIFFLNKFKKKNKGKNI